MSESSRSLPSARTFYDEVGGAPTFAASSRTFYAGVRTDPVLAPLYPQDDWDGAEARLRGFLEQYWGGPRDLLARSAATRGCGCGTPRSPSARPSGTPGCGTCARRSTRSTLSPEQDATLWGYLEMAALSMQNRFPEGPGATSPPPEKRRTPAPPLQGADGTDTRGAREPARRCHVPDGPTPTGGGRRLLPGLHPQLRRRQRRRRRRPGRHPRQAALPGRPRRRRAVDHAVLPLADGRPRLRRRRPARRRAGVRRPRRVRRPARRRPRARHPGHHRPGAQPQLARPRVVPGGAGRGARLAGAGAVPVPRRARRRRRRAAEQLALGLRRPRVDPGARRPVVPAHLRAGAARPELRPTPRWSPTSRRRCGSGWTAGSTASASTSRTAWPSPRACRTWCRRRTPACSTTTAPATSASTRTACTPCTGGSAPVLDEYPGPMAVGEVWVSDDERLAQYLRADELQLAFNFRLLTADWTADDLRDAVVDSLAAVAGTAGARPAGCCPTTTSVRHVTRYGGGEVGLRRARAAALLQLALPGAAYLYNGDELGLPNVEPARRGAAGPGLGALGPHRARPRRLPGARCRGRATKPSYGFSARRDTWLPMPEGWAELTVEAQAADPDVDAVAVPSGAGAAARRRPRSPGSRCEWLPAPDGCLAFRRPGGLVCLVNLSGCGRAAAGGPGAAGQRGRSPTARCPTTRRCGCRPEFRGSAGVRYRGSGTFRATTTSAEPAPAPGRPCREDQGPRLHRAVRRDHRGAGAGARRARWGRCRSPRRPSGVMLAGSILGARRGFLSQLLFLVLVAIGLPVLPAAVAGWPSSPAPTAGYLISWPIAAFVVGLLTERFWARYNLAWGVVANVVGGHRRHLRDRRPGARGGRGPAVERRDRGSARPCSSRAT